MSKPHGLRGDLTVKLTTDRTEERTAPGAVLCVGDKPDARLLVVKKAQPYQKVWLIHFEGVDSREAADLLRGKTLFAEPLDDLDDDTVFVHELIGCRLIDQHGADHGEILSVIDNPASDLLELAEDVLVPLRFLVEISDGKVVVDVPVGLLGVNKADEAEEDSPEDGTPSDSL